MKSGGIKTEEPSRERWEFNSSFSGCGPGAEASGENANPPLAPLRFAVFYVRLFIFPVCSSDRRTKVGRRKRDINGTERRGGGGGQWELFK